MSDNKRQIFLIAMLGAFIGPYTGSSVNVALPSIGRELGMSTLQLSWVQLAYLLSTAMFILPIGRIADLLGRKKVLYHGTWTFIVMSLMCSASMNAAVLIGSRILQGICGAAIAVSIVAMVSSAFPPGERGKVLGLTAAATYTGLSIGPFLGGFLTSEFGWRSVFWVIVPVCLLMCYHLIRLQQEWKDTAGERFDLNGALIYGFGLMCLMGGLTQVDELFGTVILAAGIGALMVFARIEKRVVNPMLDLELLEANPVVLLSSVAALINYCATFSVGYLLSLDMQYVMGYSPRTAGLVLVAQPVVQAVFSPLAGRLSDKLDAGVVASAGMALTTLGLLLFAMMPTGNVVTMVCILGLLGFGLALFVSPNTNAIMNAVEKRHYGAASGILGTARSLGQAFSMGFTALIMSLIMGNAQITESNHPAFLLSFKASFFFMAALCFLGIFASLARRKSQLNE